MVISVQQGFAQLRSNLEITGLQAETVSVRQTRVRDVLQAGMRVHESFLTGSYARHTMIAPLNEADVDVFFVLDSSYFRQYTPAGLLDAVRRTLLKTYTSTPSISRNGQAVTIRFTDFVVDVVVGFLRQGGGYVIPNSVTSKWLSTDPQRHVGIVSDANKDHSGALVPTIKMLKAWNKGNGSFFRSFHLEVLALKVFERITISDFPSGIRFFFDRVRPLIRDGILDPAGYGDNVGSYLGTQTKIDEASNRIQSALSIALAAEQHNTAGRNRAAIEQWQRLFPDYFPAYG
ncbi:CBASS oligonucleotide cyclase [Rhizobium sp. BT-226]|uniref:CBASS oligonucleotide cyclase n=1 Tax=Rhizobium sp. BT-226 TaxID=2986922 RepID=UPI0021F71725|nr:CBASS oligonucleotide cyclase [Rhizobium sp. BT-226]MCW0014933.1 CBASS oligonucleotide cyclase [Rhizobium sp. BT-226]